MPIYNQCDEEIVPPSCDACLTNIEHGRIRAVAFINESAITAIIAAPDTATAWTAAITAGNVFIIPLTSGTYDGGSPIDGPGYGDLASRNVGFTHNVIFNDPNFKLNCAFYNSLAHSTSWFLAFKTETQIRFSGVPVNIIPTSPVTDDVSSEVVWTVTARWTERDQPCPSDAPPDVFVCAPAEAG